jgi:hypothetical protein
MQRNLSHTRPSGQTTHSAFPSPLAIVDRLLEDLNQHHAELIVEHAGGDASRLLEVPGYGRVTVSALRLLGDVPKFVKIGLIVLPCRNSQGRIVALHDYQGRWITEPSPHIANAIRARWAEIRIYDTTSQADSIALSENICTIGRNGCDKKRVAAAVLSARRNDKSFERRLAA